MNRRTLGLLIALLALALAALIGGVPQHARAGPIVNEDQFQVDANANLAGIQTINAATIGSTMTISSTITIATIPYSGYRASISLGMASGLVQITGTTETPVGGATNCTGVTVYADRIFEGCSRPSGTQTDTGSAFEFTVKCLVPGSTQLYFQLDSEIGAGAGTAFIDGSGNIIPPVLGTATIYCNEPTGNSFAVDADAGTPGIQSSVTALVGSNVTIGSVLTSAPDQYTYYNSNIAYDATKLSYVSDAPSPVFSGLCSSPTQAPGRLTAGCSDLHSAPHTETGTTATYTLQCTRPGAISLHLLTSAEVGSGGSTDFLLFSPLAYADGPTQDATVNCVVPVTKTDDAGGSAIAGGQLTYTISVDDTTESVLAPCCSTYPTPGWIVDTIPAPFTYVSDDRGCTVTGATLACPVGASQPTPSVDVTVAVPLSAAGQQDVCNTATFVDDPNAATPVQLGTTATDCVDVEPSTLSVQTGATRPPSYGPYHAGDVITWAIGVSANGSPAADVLVVDTATNGFTITGSTGDANCTPDPVTPTSASFDCGTVTGSGDYLLVTGVVDSEPAGLICENAVHVTSSNAAAADASNSRPCVTNDVRMVKDTDGDLAEDGETANLFLGQGSLTVNEWAVNAGGDPQGVGAFEFELGYDNHIFDVDIQPTGWLYSTGRVPGAAGVGGCSASVISENSIRFGCVSENPTSGAAGCLGPDDATVVTEAQCGVMADGSIATITLTPKPDLIKRLTPGNDNGVISTVLDQGCELADIWGHPLSSGFDALGRPIPLPGILPGGQVADCGDLTVTVRILEGDMNTDCTVDVSDDQLEAAHYGATFGSLLYEPWYDLEPALKDGDVDVKDLQKVFGRNGSTCAAPVPPQDPLPAPGDP